MRIYNWGIIGPGLIAHKFAQDLKVGQHMCLHAIASRSQERAERFARQYQANYAYGSYEELLDCPDLDVIYIATPHTSHCEHTIMCLNRQIPVLCEKPFAMNSQEAREMVEAARANDTFLMEAMWTCFLPTFKTIFDLIEEGKLGSILSIKADFGFRPEFEPSNRIFNQALGGGALLDIGIYPVFLALLLMGEPEQVKAMANIGTTNVDEDCGILLQYADGRMAHLHATFLATTKTEAFIYGEKGTIQVHSRWHEPTWLSFIDEAGRPQNYHYDWPGNGYHYEAEEVVKCLDQNKKESDRLPLDFSFKLSQLLDRIRKEAGIVYPGIDR